MVGPINSIGAESTAPSGIVSASRSDSTASAASSTSVTLGSLGGAGVLGNSLAIAEVFSVIADMLEEIGGDLENDQVLQALIALLILMALLQGAGDASGSRQSLLGGSGLSAGSGPLLMASSYTKTTIFIEQTTVTTTFQISAESAAAFDPGQLESSGNSIDISA